MVAVTCSDAGHLRVSTPKGSGVAPPPPQGRGDRLKP